jgi:hypothetical protein
MSKPNWKEANDLSVHQIVGLYRWLDRRVRKIAVHLALRGGLLQADKHCQFFLDDPDQRCDRIKAENGTIRVRFREEDYWMNFEDLQFPSWLLATDNFTDSDWAGEVFADGKPLTPLSANTTQSGKDTPTHE